MEGWEQPNYLQSQKFVKAHEARFSRHQIPLPIIEAYLPAQSPNPYSKVNLFGVKGLPNGSAAQLVGTYAAFTQFFSPMLTDMIVETSA